MMKIRYALLLSVSCLGLGSFANAGLTPNITPIGKNTFIFTQRGAPAGESLLRVSRPSYTHLASQSKLLSASVIARRTSSDEAIHYNINGSPRRLSPARDDNSGTAFGREDYFFDLDVRVKPEHDIANFLSTHPVLPYQGKGRCSLSPVFPLLIERVRVSRSFPIPTQSARSAILSPINPQLTDRVKLHQLASVCFITDAGNCREDDFGGAGTDNPDNSSGETPGGSSSGGDNPEWDLDNKERCNKEGYTLTSCSSVQDPVNFCPYDNSYFEKCVCKPNLVTCTKPYYGVGESCGGKYASCQLDNARACKEDGYTQTGSCNSVQNINKRCPYDANYFDKCVCRSDLYTCSSPLQGVGTACGGKYANCKCPSSYKSCECGKASGAKSCTWNGTTKYSSCKACCDDTCPSGTSKTYKGAYAGKTECGNSCYKCNCPSGTGPNFSGAAAGSSECGTCYRCSNTCPQGSVSPRCSSSESKEKVATTECGSSCYECKYNPDCTVREERCSWDEICSNRNSCNKCTSCQHNSDCDVWEEQCASDEICSSTNSCGICTQCTYNSDCSATDKSCEYGCADTNSCGKCIECKEKPITYTATYSGTSYCQDGGNWTNGPVGEFCNVSVSCTNGYSSSESHIVDSHKTMDECTPHDCSIHDVSTTNFHPSRCGM